MHREKAASCLGQILETTHNKTAAVWPLASYLTNHSSKMNKTCGALLEKQGQTHKRCFPMDVWANQQRLFTSALYGHRIQPRRPARRDG